LREEGGVKDQVRGLVRGSLSRSLVKLNRDVVKKREKKAFQILRP